MTSGAPNSMNNYINTAISWVRPTALFSGGGVVLASALLYFTQNQIIYPRNIPADARTHVPSPARFGISNFEELDIPTPDGETLNVYLVRPSNQQYARNITVLMFHGNAGNIGYRVPIAKILANDLGCNVFMLQYRGYGKSTGTPNEKGLNIDAQTGLDYIRNRNDLNNTKFVIYGQSLGGAVGISLAAKNQSYGDIAGIILENTFTSIRKLIPSALPPAKYLTRLCHQLWASDEALPKIKTIPILFLSGLQDQIVPASHMKELYDKCRTTLKVWKDFPDGTHNDTCDEAGYFQAINAFIRDVVITGKDSISDEDLEKSLKQEPL